MKKYDERNTIFSRVSLEKGSKEYKEYYNKNKETKVEDDFVRGIKFRHVLRKNEEFKKRFFPLITNNKLYIKSLFNLANDFEIKELVKVPMNFSSNIKEITKYYGATDVGITKLDEYSFYSHSGGLSEELDLKNYNQEIKSKFSTAIVFTVKMDLEMMNRAPNFEELLATEQAYYKIAEIGSRLAIYLKSLGYDAFVNNSEYYLSPLVPLALDAGLGEIGMCNHIVTMEHGDNVRLGAVFTNLIVNTDKPLDFGLIEFCKKCALCLMNCPSKSITHKPRMVNGRQFYKFDDNSCYNLWTKTGTDCGVCIQSCPFTQGLDLEKVKKMKEFPELMDELMKDHLEKIGRRKYAKKDLPIVDMSDKDES